MGAAAEFQGGPHLHHANNISVLFPEEGGCAQLLRLGYGENQGLHVDALEDQLHDPAADLGQLLGGQGVEMGEVKTQVIGFHQRAGLMAVVPQHGLQRILKQVRGGVGAANCLTAPDVNGGVNLVVGPDLAGDQVAVVEILAALVLEDVPDLEDGAARSDGAAVGHLAAHFGIEGRLVQDQNAVLAARDGAGNLSFHHHCGRVVQPEVDPLPGQIAQLLPGLPCPQLLLLEEAAEALLVHGHPGLLGHVRGEIQGEAVGVG